MTRHVLEYDSINQALIATEWLGKDEYGAAEIVAYGVPHWIGASIAAAFNSPDLSPCWFCGRFVSIDYLIAGYDTFEEQRLACLDCNRTLEALGKKGYELKRRDTEGERGDG